MQLPPSWQKTGNPAVVEKCSIINQGTVGQFALGRAWARQAAALALATGHTRVAAKVQNFFVVLRHLAGARRGLLVLLCGIVSLYAGLVHAFLLLEAWREKELMGTRAREEDSWI